MKIGVISDIHSNYIAFQACVAYLETLGCEEYFLLGDFVSDTTDTRETLDFLYDFIATHSCRLLRGNREDYMLNQRKALLEGDDQNIWIWNSASGNLKFTYEQLTEADLDFFDRLPICFRYEYPGYPAITCCHGSPENNRELLQFRGENTKEWLEKLDTEYLICGHTHYPGAVTYAGKQYFNSGCVGIAIGDYGMAQCMILESATEGERKSWKPTFLKIPYDHLEVVRRIIDKGLLNKAPWFINSNIQTLLTGEDYAAKMVAMANTLSKQEKPGSAWPLIEEEYFARAADYYGIPDYRERSLLYRDVK